MTEEQKQRIEAWCVALESGKYNQCRNALRTTDMNSGPSYCCLGVACDISGLGKWAGPVSGSYVTGKYSSCDVFTDPLVEWYGLSWKSVELIDPDGSTCSAVFMNDDLGYDFRAIASAIRRTYLAETAYSELKNAIDAATEKDGGE